VVGVAEAEARRGALQILIAQFAVLLGQDALQDLAAEAGILAPDRSPGRPPYGRTRLAGDHHPLPRRRRRLRLRPDDLDLVAVVELADQRRVAPVDAAPDATVAHVGMHRIGEIDRRRPAWQGDQQAL